MADLDVSEILLDPDFTTSFTVVRRTESINDKGRSVQTPTSFPNTIGVITRTSPNEVVRDAEGSQMGRSITIVTTFRLRALERGQQPDQIDWNGDVYTVMSADPYTHFGAGFIQATAQVQAASSSPTT